jgi:metallo-beta-lactamase family protein
MKITFIGGVERLQVQKTLVDSNDRRILIDCGLFQGVKPTEN